MASSRPEIQILLRLRTGDRICLGYCSKCPGASAYWCVECDTRLCAGCAARLHHPGLYSEHHSVEPLEKRKTQARKGRDGARRSGLRKPKDTNRFKGTEANEPSPRFLVIWIWLKRVGLLVLALRGDLPTFLFV